MVVIFKIPGVSYAEGLGVEKDDVEAARWYQKAADLGDMDAIVCLGARCETGRGVVKNVALAFQYYGVLIHWGLSQ